MDDYINIISSVSRQGGVKWEDGPTFTSQRWGHDPGGPPPLRSPVPRTSTYRSGPYESRQEKTDLPKTKLCCQTGPSTTSNYRGMLYVTTGTGPTEAHQDGPPPKRNYYQSGSTTTSNNRSGPHLGCQDGPLRNRNCFRNGPTTLNYTGAGPCWSCQDESFQKEMPTKNVPTQQHSLPELARTYCKSFACRQKVLQKKFCVQLVGPHKQLTKKAWLS